MTTVTRVLIVVLSAFIFQATLAQAKWDSEGWLILLKVKFGPKFLKQYNETYREPIISPSLQEKIGKEMSLSGYYLPFELDSNRIILSKWPYAACFFCGGGGPESVIEVYLTEERPKLTLDQVIRVRGKLKVNDSDTDHLNFILQEAKIIEDLK